MILIIRPETSADREAVREVVRLAFGQVEEADLVDALCAQGYMRLSMIVELDGQIGGHILFSELSIVGESGTVAALSLAPMAVHPEFQNRGIGSALIRKALEACRELGHRIVIVLGYAHYYARFGFRSELTANLESPFAGDSFMALELVPEALKEVRGRVVYPPPFGAWT